MIENERLSAKQIRAIEVLLASPTTRAAAKTIGCGEATIFRWLADSSFLTAYRNARNRAYEATLSALQAASGEAVETLVSIMRSGETKPKQVSACRAILEFGLKAREALEIEERLQALESRLTTRKGFAA